MAGRILEPAGEIVALADYRLRHACNRLDPDLQRLHQMTPMIALWDDHETANNSWEGGAQNHDPETEGLWSARRAAAVQAYQEWMPVSEKPWKAYRVGDLATLYRTESRLIARSREPDRPIGAHSDRWCARCRRGLPAPASFSSCLRAASPPRRRAVGARGGLAVLPILRRVDPGDAYFSAVDAQGVAVDDVHRAPVGRADSAWRGIVLHPCPREHEQEQQHRRAPFAEPGHGQKEPGASRCAVLGRSGVSSS